MKFLQESPVEFLASIPGFPGRTYFTGIKGRLGTLFISGTERGIISSSMVSSKDKFIHGIEKKGNIKLSFEKTPFIQWIESIENYLDGGNEPVKAVIQPVNSTDFTIKVHRFLIRIPFGTTVTYGELSSEIGHPGAARAVGSACGRNNALIIVPCHRVVAVNGLGGFGGGLELKKKLLEHESVSI